MAKKIDKRGAFWKVLAIFAFFSTWENETRKKWFLHRGRGMNAQHAEYQTQSKITNFIFCKISQGQVLSVQWKHNAIFEDKKPLCKTITKSWFKG